MKTTISKAKWSQNATACMLLKIIYSVYNWVADTAPQGNKTSVEMSIGPSYIGAKIDEPSKECNEYIYIYIETGKTNRKNEIKCKTSVRPKQSRRVKVETQS